MPKHKLTDDDLVRCICGIWYPATEYIDGHTRCKDCEDQLNQDDEDSFNDFVDEVMEE
jgi:hypothetical protein